MNSFNREIEVLKDKAGYFVFCYILRGEGTSLFRLRELYGLFNDV